MKLILKGVTIEEIHLDDDSRCNDLPTITSMQNEGGLPFVTQPMGNVGIDSPRAWWEKYVNPGDQVTLAKKHFPSKLPNELSDDNIKHIWEEETGINIKDGSEIKPKESKTDKNK